MFEADGQKPSMAAEVAGNSTLILLLMAHLQQRGMIDPIGLRGMAERAEQNARRESPAMAGSVIMTQTLAWLDAQIGEQARTLTPAPRVL